MHDLASLTPLGGTTARTDRIGILTISEITDCALASVASRHGQEASFATAAARLFGIAPPPPGTWAAGGPWALIWSGPDQWFAEAHRVGLGAELELLVARNAISVCAILPPSASLSINISPDTLLQSEQVAHALSGFDPRRLVIEITEHHPVADYQSIV
ncbi:MAG: hypothetical protein ACK5IP_02705, partial [Paracoccus sp. (in: a-proteobacteria)]